MTIIDMNNKFKQLQLINKLKYFSGQVAINEEKFLRNPFPTLEIIEKKINAHYMAIKEINIAVFGLVNSNAEFRTIESIAVERLEKIKLIIKDLDAKLSKIESGE